MSIRILVALGLSLTVVLSAPQGRRVALNLSEEWKNEVVLDSQRGKLLAWQVGDRRGTVRLPNVGRGQVVAPKNNSLIVREFSSRTTIDVLPIEGLPQPSFLLPSATGAVVRILNVGQLQYETKVWELSKQSRDACSDPLPSFLYPVEEDRWIVFASIDSVFSAMHVASDCKVLLRRPLDEQDAGAAPVNRAFTVSRVAGSFGYIASHRPATIRPEILVRSIADLSLMHRIEAPEGRFWELAYSPEGRMIAADVFLTGPPLNEEARHVVMLFDVASKRLVRRFDIDGRYGLAFSPDGTILAAGQRERRGRQVRATVGLYDVASGQRLGSAEHEWESDSESSNGELKSLVFMPDGRFLLTSTYNTRVWEILVSNR